MHYSLVGGCVHTLILHFYALPALSKARTASPADALSLLSPLPSSTQKLYEYHSIAPTECGGQGWNEESIYAGIRDTALNAQMRSGRGQAARRPPLPPPFQASLNPFASWRM